MCMHEMCILGQYKHLLMSPCAPGLKHRHKYKIHPSLSNYNDIYLSYTAVQQDGTDIIDKSCELAILQSRY